VRRAEAVCPNESPKDTKEEGKPDKTSEKGVDYPTAL
jgi:hypothetical protein